MGHADPVKVGRQDRRAQVRPERRKAGAFRLPLSVLAQPDESTCGPTCLHAVFRYWQDEEPLEAVIGRARRMAHGGTLAVFLACDALRRGYRVTLYTYNITVFDPTWFRDDASLEKRLEKQRQAKEDFRLQLATEGYLEFLRLGGRLRFVDLTAAFLHAVLQQRLPIITGLSATYLYRTPRETFDGRPDDIQGLPAGHFVVLAGFNAVRRSLLVLDPYEPTPYGSSHAYWVSADRVLGSILLGIVTHDANLLVVHPADVPPPDASVEPINHFETT